MQDIVDCLTERAYVLAEKSLFIARAELMFEGVHQRLLWAYLVQQLLKSKIVNLTDLMSTSNSNF